MSDQLPWHEDDSFWLAMAPLFFSEEHWAAAPREVAQVISLLGLSPGDRILDLGCGPGRHSLELARRGLQVTGVDRTVAYLDAARRRADDEGLSVEFVLEDMRRFTRPCAFDAAVSLSTSFGYFEDAEEDRLVLRNVHESLGCGGSLLIHMMGAETVARDFRAAETYRSPDGAVVAEERELSADGSWYEKRRRILRGDHVLHDFRVSHRLYTAEGMAALLAGCGFERAKVFGDLGGAPYDENAGFLVALARKRHQGE